MVGARILPVTVKSHTEHSDSLMGDGRVPAYVFATTKHRGWSLAVGGVCKVALGHSRVQPAPAKNHKTAAVSLRDELGG